MITRYEDVDAVLRDGRFVKDIRNIYSAEDLAQILPKGHLDFIARGLNQSMVASNVPDHTRLRSLMNLSFTPMNLSFTPRLIEQWRERVQAISQLPQR
jgi:cytochrome P450